MTISALTPAPAALSFGPHTTDLVRSILKACKSDHTRRSYARGISALDVFADGRPISRLLLLDWRRAMDRENKSVGTINVRLTAVRKLVNEARRTRLIGADDAAELLDVPGLAQRGTHAGIWLDVDQARRLLAVPDRRTLRGQRNYCVLAILLGCGLRRDELVRLDCDHLQKRDGRWIVENIKGKGGRTRSVAIPEWVMEAILDWLSEARIRSGRVIRQLTLEPIGLSDDTISSIVNKAAAKIGIPDVTPHDLRRTCAKLCRKNGGLLEQIQFMLGHASLVTTERYLGGTQDLKSAVNDFMGI
jgi:integrase